MQEKNNRLGEKSASDDHSLWKQLALEALTVNFVFVVFFFFFQQLSEKLHSI